MRRCAALLAKGLASCLEVCIDELERDLEIFRPDFTRADPLLARVWAASASEKLSKERKRELNGKLEAMPLEDCNRAKARLLSCGGIGAQWLASAPTSHLMQLSDADMRSCVRFRLGSETFTGHVCPHVTADGVECAEVCDREGYHLLTCSSGGGYFVGHDGVCAVTSGLASGNDGIPGVVADWKPHVEVWPRATRGAEADVGFYRLPGMRDTYVDAVCSLANPQRYPGCERRTGTIAEKKTREKPR